MNTDDNLLPDTQVRYTKLSALDAKCGALLQLSSVLLVFISLDPVRALVGSNSALQRLIVVALLVSCLLQLFVLWFKEQPDEALVQRRIRCFNVAAAITALACLVVGCATAAALLRN